MALAFFAFLLLIPVERYAQSSLNEKLERINNQHIVYIQQIWIKFLITNNWLCR
jgi:hypothetical protein